MRWWSFALLPALALAGIQVEVARDGHQVTGFWQPLPQASYRIEYFPYPELTPGGAFEVGQRHEVRVILPEGASFAFRVRAEGEGGTVFSEVRRFELTPQSTGQPTPAEVVAAIGRNVIVATYCDLASMAARLSEATVAARFEPERLEEVKQAWIAARVAWEQAEAFLFGPVVALEIDPSLDSWPVNATDLEALLTGSSPITPEGLRELEPTVRGFHGLEYLLWSRTSMDERAWNYLGVATRLLEEDARRLCQVWREEELARWGSDPQRALSELLTAMGELLEELAEGKLSEPLQSGNPQLLESPFSQTSLFDYENNLRGIENLYLGRYGLSDGPGLTDLVRQRDPGRDLRFREALARAKEALAAVPPPLEGALTTHPQKVQGAVEALRGLGQLLDRELRPLLLGGG